MVLRSMILSPVQYEWALLSCISHAALQRLLLCCTRGSPTYLLDGLCHVVHADLHRIRQTAQHLLLAIMRCLRRVFLYGVDSTIECARTGVTTFGAVCFRGRRRF